MPANAEVTISPPARVREVRAPSDPVQFGMAFRYQLSHYFRTKRLLGLAVFTLLPAGSADFLTGYYSTGGPNASTFAGVILGEYTITGVVIGAFMGGDAVSMDLGSGTGYYTLAFPIRRTTLLLGRYMAAFVVSLLLAAIFYATAATGAYAADGWATFPTVAFLTSFGVAALFGSGVLSVAFAFSSAFRNPAISMILTVLVLFLGLGTTTGRLESAGVAPWFSIIYAGDLITLVMPSPGGGLFGAAAYPVSTSEGVAIMTAYAVIFLFLSALVYEFREMKG